MFVSQGVYLRAFIPLPCTLVKTLKEIFDQPETMWLQFRRRLNKLEPFCRIAGHTSEEAVKPPKCTFSGVVPIELKRFLDSGIGRVECPGCACTRTFKPQGGVLRFKSHDKRKIHTPNTDQRWARRETIWEVVGGEST